MQFCISIGNVEFLSETLDFYRKMSNSYRIQTSERADFIFSIVSSVGHSADNCNTNGIKDEMCFRISIGNPDFLSELFEFLSELFVIFGKISTAETRVFFENKPGFR